MRVMLATTIGMSLAAGFCLALHMDKKGKRKGEGDIPNREDRHVSKKRRITLSESSLALLEQEEVEEEVDIQSAPIVQVDEALAKAIQKLPYELQEYVLFEAGMSSRQTCLNLLWALQSRASRTTRWKLMRIYLHSCPIYRQPLDVIPSKRLGFFLDEDEEIPTTALEVSEVACTTSLFTQLPEILSDDLHLTLLDDPREFQEAQWEKVTKLSLLGSSSFTYQHPDFNMAFTSLTHLALNLPNTPSFDPLHPLTVLPQLQCLVYLVHRPNFPAVITRGTDWDVLLAHIFNDRRVCLLPGVPVLRDYTREDKLCQWWSERGFDDVWESAKMYTNDRAVDILRRTLSEHLTIPDITALEIMSSLFTPTRSSCTSTPLTPNAVSPGSIVKRLTIGEKLVKIPVDSNFMLDRVVRGLASEARDWEVGVSWFEEIFRERSGEPKRKGELRLTILDSDSLPCQGFWPSYRAPELERVTHLCLARGLGWANVDWTAFPSLTHLALPAQDHKAFSELLFIIAPLRALVPAFSHLLVILPNLDKLDLMQAELSQVSNHGVNVHFTSKDTFAWDGCNLLS